MHLNKNPHGPKPVRKPKPRVESEVTRFNGKIVSGKRMLDDSWAVTIITKAGENIVATNIRKPGSRDPFNREHPIIETEEQCRQEVKKWDEFLDKKSTKQKRIKEYGQG